MMIPTRRSKARGTFTGIRRRHPAPRKMTYLLASTYALNGLKRLSTRNPRAKIATKKTKASQMLEANRWPPLSWSKFLLQEMSFL